MEIFLPMAHCHSAIERNQTSSGLTFALQALLNRHESYVSDSQQEHQRLTEYISELEEEKTHLQTRNDKIVEENRHLLTQLEAANTSLKDSDSHVKSLEALLRDCELEVRRLNSLSRRTEELELKILELERERLTTSRHADDSREETRSTIKRWKESEVKVRQLEHELQRIEWDAKQDKERYEEIIARLERERAVERELGGAEGRLKGAAALRGLHSSEKGSTVVSHFVRDILQDNANLQAGIVELRELLQTSNEEVQNLREQVLQHQPIDDIDGPNTARSVPLSEQLSWTQSSPKVQQSVHVHHHYHAKLGKRERTPTVRKSSRKRAVVGLGMLASTPESSAPSTPKMGPQRFVSSPMLPSSFHHPQPMRNRWSVQSTATGSSMASSLPSSPRSYFEQPGSIFDRLEAGEESSRPTSPESTGFSHSPSKFHKSFGFHEEKPDPLEKDENEDVPIEEPTDELPESDSVPNEQNQPTKTESGSQELTPKPSQMLIVDDGEDHEIQPEPPDLIVSPDPADEAKATLPEIVVEAEPVISLDLQHEADDVPSDDPEVIIRPGLRRTSSNDSLVSISGMDIHIAKRPTSSKSQSSSFLRGNKAYFALPPSAARRMPSAQPLTTVTEYTALSSMRSPGSDTSSIHSTGTQLPQRSVSSSVAALSGLAGLPVHHDEQRSVSGGLGRLVGGWVKGKWGIAPVQSNTDLRSSAASVSTSSSTDSHPQTDSFSFPGGRLPGINQKGPIAGWRAPPRITSVQVKMMDEEGLRESLAE